ncbi:AfsR/SARP family transcriptional regulator [Actinokineospora diospyrosa]|uniref:DNA-binding transcriptional activator of the SARP family n=1 Tax=Actinokineospora diospyrosa TaxID=103728 RepID=A0ABT1I5V4_9PSEU|nr:BTAD domain-containing putative transcriptional regulator [Actinokineospora diospyrosa]MCP2268004.1 DNA-binding transcriptional activator of the SARP family [Actinokineospora diospyrosa]
MDFRVLGPVEAWRAGGRLAIGGSVQRSSLAVLLVNVNRVVPLEYFVDQLTASERRDARGAVRRRMSRLRAVLDVGATVLAARQGGYVLSVDPESVDLRRFERLVAQARAARAGGDRARAVRLLGDALGLWRGPALTGVVDGVREAAASHLEEARLQAVEDRAELRIVLGEQESVVTELSGLVVDHPVRERLVGLLMLALSKAGRRAEALAVFTRTRRRLVQELGIEPGETLRQAQREVLSGGPPTPVVATGPAQLPAAPATFTGRDEELAALLRSTAAVTAIDGMAGVGKTALAVHAAHRLAARFPDGQLFVDLHGFTGDRAPVDPGEALEWVLRAIGLPRIPAAFQERAALWRATVAERRLLLVLDNAAGEAQVRPLLPGGSNCLVLVTSRRRLAGLDDAVALSLPVLPPADAVTLFDRMSDRAAAPALVAEVVELCARLPLAIRVAAARLRHRTTWTVAHLAERLRDERNRLTELAAGDRSVTAAFDVSYAHLDHRQQRMFRLLGLHPGPDLDATAAAALTQVDDPAGGLEELLDANLLQQHEPGRYRMHDLVRAHAARLATRTDTPTDRRAALSRLAALTPRQPD